MNNMYFMMRGGMDGGMHGSDGESFRGENQSSTTTPPTTLDGSHGHIDRP